MLATLTSTLLVLLAVEEVYSAPSPVATIQPATITMKAKRLVKSTSKGAGRRTLGPANDPLKDFFSGTDLQ